MKTRTSTRWRQAKAPLLVLGGAALSTLLLLRTMALAVGDATSFDYCGNALSASCDETLITGGNAWLGLPWAGWGLVYYAALGVLVLLALAPSHTFSRALRRSTLLLAGAGACVSCVLAARMLLGDAAPCPLCFAVHGLNLTLLAVLWRGAMRDGRGTRSRRALVAQRAGAWLGLTCAVLLGGLVYQHVAHEWQARGSGAAPAADFPRMLRAWQESARVDIPLRADDPRIGPADAPAEVVIFSSFECAGCAQLARFMRTASRRLGSRMTVVFKHFPLCAECNPEVDADYHPLACVAARAAEAAHAQGRFWNFHDAIFAVSLVTGESALPDTARALELDPVRFEQDRASSEARERVAADVALARRLGVQGTPTIFLNGRRIEERGVEAVARLIWHAAVERAGGV